MTKALHCRAFVIAVTLGDHTRQGPTKLEDEDGRTSYCWPRIATARVCECAASVNDGEARQDEFN